MKTIMEWFFKTVIVLSFMVFCLTLAIVFDVNIKLEYPDENPPKELVSKTDSLKAVVADLEAKVEILNRYLVQKNLEYIDACDLKTKP